MTLCCREKKGEQELRCFPATMTIPQVIKRAFPIAFSISIRLLLFLDNLSKSSETPCNSEQVSATVAKVQKDEGRLARAPPDIRTCLTFFHFGTDLTDLTRLHTRTAALSPRIYPTTNAGSPAVCMH